MAAWMDGLGNGKHTAHSMLKSGDGLSRGCMSTHYVSTYGGWINAASTESDCFVQKLAAPASHDDLRIQRSRRPCFSAPWSFPSWPLTTALLNLVPVLMCLFGRVDVAKLLNCCRSRITPHECRATPFDHRQAASSTLLYPAACTILLEAVRAWLRLCRAAASVFRFHRLSPL